MQSGVQSVRLRCIRRAGCTLHAKYKSSLRAERVGSEECAARRGVAWRGVARRAVCLRHLAWKSHLRQSCPQRAAWLRLQLPVVHKQNHLYYPRALTVKETSREKRRTRERARSERASKRVEEDPMGPTRRDGPSLLFCTYTFERAYVYTCARCRASTES